MTIQQQLEQVARLMETAPFPHCIDTAISALVHEFQEREVLRAVVIDRIGLQPGRDARVLIWKWSDAQDSHQEALEVLRGRAEYRDFLIELDDVARSVGAKSIWRYTHRDYDGDEDQRIGGEITLAACKAAIDGRFFDGEQP